MRHGGARFLGSSKNARHEAGRSVFAKSATTQSGILQIGRRLLAALGHDFISEALAFVERAHAGAFDRADVDEHVLRAVARRDESETLLRIEELDCTCGHGGLLASVAAWDAHKRSSLRALRHPSFLG